MATTPANKMCSPNDCDLLRNSPSSTPAGESAGRRGESAPGGRRPDAPTWSPRARRRRRLRPCTAAAQRRPVAGRAGAGPRGPSRRIRTATIPCSSAARQKRARAAPRRARRGSQARRRARRRLGGRRCRSRRRCRRRRPSARDRTARHPWRRPCPALRRAWRSRPRPTAARRFAPRSGPAPRRRRRRGRPGACRGRAYRVRLRHRRRKCRRVGRGCGRLLLGFRRSRRLRAVVRPRLRILRRAKRGRAAPRPAPLAGGSTAPAPWARACLQSRVRP
mmetsp:Transcript_29929/g.100857  ORF Transcript_29929/g.100857 Transcript_29929/m.100857 type:complete len:277 (-) Transcript_29929:1120-1950(-)